MGNELTLSVVDSLAGMTALREEWNRLLEQSRARNICLRWEWLHAWWEVYHDSGLKPCVLLVREGSRLVGLAPFYLQIRKRFGVFSFRTLRFLGTGEPEWEEVASEYLDIAALDGYEDGVASLMWEHLCASKSWDQLVFDDVLEDSLVLKVLRNILDSERMPAALESTGVRYRIGLPRTWQEYIAALDPGAAKRLPYKRRKFERAGRVAEKLVVDPAGLDRAFDDLVRLHTSRWAERGQAGAFASPRFTAYHKKLARMLLPLGMLKVRTLSLDDATVAVLLNYQCGNTEYFYQGGFDLEAAAKYSPGIVAHVCAIESAIRAGLGHYDFMKGGASSYKTEFGCAEDSMWKLIVYSRSWRGRWLALENRVRSRLRMIKRKIRKPGDVPTKPDDGVPSVENTRAPRQASREADSMNSMRRNIIAAERTDHVR
jgi:CelD/BcsL family acetyltransferase involved in cellulose biosynthesis